MTEINLPTSSAGPPESSSASAERTPGADEPAGTSFASRVLVDVLARASAKIGLLWIILLVVCAVFAPLLANSHPLLMRSGGRWSSPMLRHLSPADSVLQIGFWAGAVLVIVPGLSRKARWWSWSAVLVLAMIICPLTVHPPQLVVYEAYRLDQQAGKIERALYAPIAFSPDDHLRDQPDARLTAPSSTHWGGTTSDSADLLSNLIYACRIALSIGFISTGIALILGIIIGGLMGYYVGWVDLLG
ncbi:MAG TPA: hypothetical protein VLI90_04500, partial [Tepidisphaeraceae bacterium]|nr:hypothetical protein [Tepidisphaeraceae bacterium]